MGNDNERTEDTIQTEYTPNQDQETMEEPNQDQESVEEPSQTPEPVKMPSLKFIKVMLLLIAIGTLWLGLQTSSSRILMVEIRSSLLSGEASDRTQVSNALRNGGLIRLENNGDSYASLLGEHYYDYGAKNSANYFFVLGAALNYISSQGWTLVQAPESGATGYYYFVRTRSRITEFITY